MSTVVLEPEIARRVSKNEVPFQKVTFGKLTPDSFQKDVKARVDKYFEERNLSKNFNAQMLIKTILILTTWVGTYVLILSNLISPWGMFGLALIHGFATAMIGLNIGHDAIHGAYTKSQKMNKFLGVFFNLVGANDYVWNITHNIVHHTYTNIPEHDEDIRQIPILRMEPTQKLSPIHRFQYIYAFGLYCFASLSWVFIKDFKKFFQHRVGGHYRKTFPRREIFRLFFFKAIYYSVFVVAPFMIIDLAWYWILIGFVAAHFVEGFTMAIIFMLAHIIEGTKFPEPNAEGKIDMPWADFQMYTTADFAIKNRVVNYLTGGLNFQVVHHLFPKVCHIHYPKLSAIVKQTAHDHGLPYTEYATFSGAIASHTRLLKKFGKPSLN